MICGLSPRSGAALLQQLNYAIQIGITGAELPCEPVSAALGNPFAIGNHVKLAGLTRSDHGCNAEALLYEGHETRDLSLVVLSGGAGNDFDLHSGLQFIWCAAAAGAPKFLQPGPPGVNECNATRKVVLLSARPMSAHERSSDRLLERFNLPFGKNNVQKAMPEKN